MRSESKHSVPLSGSDPHPAAFRMTTRRLQSLMRKTGRAFFVPSFALLLGNAAFAQVSVNKLNCDDPHSPWPCLDRIFHQSFDPEYKGKYIGHDEPGVNFYSDVPGSGNFSQYKLILPKDPPQYPTAANLKGTGGPTVWNFQLHRFFWFGMVLCDTESYPEYTRECTPDSDENIFDDPDPQSPKYIGHHPGTAAMEMGFEPPGWGVLSTGNTGTTTNQWTASIGINSFNAQDPGPTGFLFYPGNGGVLNNAACLNSVGLETGTFALVTLDGKSQAPADPLTVGSDPNASAIIPGKTFLMNPGDTLIVTMHDTPEGYQVIIQDLTTKQTGSMTASIANGFGHVVFDPNASTCTSRPYAYHPMYATSGPHTRIPWAATTGNIKFTDEIGHFNYCDTQDNSISPGLGVCLSSPVESEFDPVTGLHEADDQYCVDAASSLANGALGPLGGCADGDVDWDGLSYRHAWPGSGKDPYGFSAVPEPIRFTSPKFRPAGAENGELRNYSRVAFETNVLANESFSYCPLSGGPGCVIPPPGALFYPIFTTTMRDEQCWWQFGGASIPATTNNFGGSAVTEYNTQEATLYITGTTANPGSSTSVEDFYRVLPNNPCVNE